MGASLVLQVAILASSVHSGTQTQATIAAAVLSVLSLLALGPLSHLEHTKSPRPSFLVNGFLLLTVLFDIVHVRTQWLLGQNKALAAILTVSLGFKCALLVLEAVEKRSLLVGLRDLSKEATSGIFSHGTFWWLNSLLVAGSKRTLLLDDLPAIHEKLDSERLGIKFQTAWYGCMCFMRVATFVDNSLLTLHRRSQKTACVGAFLHLVPAVGAPGNCHPEVLSRCVESEPGLSGSVYG